MQINPSQGRMITILIVEDDDAIRNNIHRLLKLEGFDTISAPDGRVGLERAHNFKPGLIISDVSMPHMDGFELLAAVRADKALATLPFILLTALDDRESTRRGMTGGADDYLSKPFTRNELLDAVNAQIRKRGLLQEVIESKLAASESRLREEFSHRIGGGQTQAFTVSLPNGTVTELLPDATVLFSDIRNFTSLAEKLGSAEVAELLNEYFDHACQPVLKNGGHHLKFIGDGLMSVFTNTAHGSPLPASRRAVSAALAIALEAHEFRGWLERRFPDRGLPPFAIGVGLHTGEVTLCEIGTLQSREIAPIGDTVNTAARLEAASKDLGWTVVASTAVLARAGVGIQTGARSTVAVRGKEIVVEVLEITGLVTSMDDKVHGMASLTERALEISEAVKANSEITARAVKGALDAKLSSLKGQVFDPQEVSVRLKGYRITKKIGSGGMTEVYLAERETDGLPIVLKILDSRGKEASEHLVRSIREIALALEAIHQSGIVHRDIKPENIMLRADGSVALADFGIAKSMLQADGLGFTQTRHGDVVGTPYYLSPEQASGRKVTTQSDLYSLGVMMFEMLAGRRPFMAESLELLLAMHINAETPALPTVHAHLQEILNKLMHKEPGGRYASASDLLADLDCAGT